MKAEPFAFEREETNLAIFYIWDQFWARSAGVEGVVAGAAAQPSGNSSLGEHAHQITFKLD